MRRLVVLCQVLRITVSALVVTVRQSESVSSGSSLAFGATAGPQEVLMVGVCPWQVQSVDEDIGRSSAASKALKVSSFMYQQYHFFFSNLSDLQCDDLLHIAVFRPGH
jgi:hypothetical protein